MTPNTVWVQDKGLWVVSYVGPQVSGAISIGNSVLQIDPRDPAVASTQHRSTMSQET